MRFSRRQALKGLAGLVGGFTLGPSVSETSYAQQVIVVSGYDEKLTEQAMAHLAVSKMTQFAAGHMPHNQGAVLRTLSGLNRDLAWMNLYHAQNRNTIIIINNQQNQNNQGNQLLPEYRESKTFVARRLNRDPTTPSRLSWKFFDKLNDTIYSADEPMTYGVYLAFTGQREKIKIKLYDPQINLVAQTEAQPININEPSFEILSENIPMQNIHSQGGNGTYVVTYEYGDKFWEARSFKLFK